MTGRPGEVSKDAFKRAAAMFPSGVAVVTSGHRGLVHAITVSAFSSVSLDPPQVLACVSRWSRLNQIVIESDAFAVNILASDQARLSDYFATTGREPVESLLDLGIPHSLHATGNPVLHGAAAFFDCAVVMACESGDHSIFIGDVLAAGVEEGKEPLLYYDRGYRRIAQR